MKYKIELYPETCCDFCGEVIHNHFDCPICKGGNEPTDLYDRFDIRFNKNISCEICNTKFNVLSVDYEELIIEKT